MKGLGITGHQQNDIEVDERSRGRGRRQQNPVNRSYDINGPDVRVRGTASQVFEKYQALARDIRQQMNTCNGNYQQHAEHYFRILQVSSHRPVKIAGSQWGIRGTSQPDQYRGNTEGEDNGAEPLLSVRANGEKEAPKSPPGPLQNVNRLRSWRPVRRAHKY